MLASILVNMKLIHKFHFSTIIFIKINKNIPFFLKLIVHYSIVLYFMQQLTEVGSVNESYIIKFSVCQQSFWDELCQTKHRIGFILAFHDSFILAYHHSYIIGIDGRPKAYHFAHKVNKGTCFSCHVCFKDFKIRSWKVCLT